MHKWLIVKKGDGVVIAPNDPRLEEIIVLPSSASRLDREHPTISLTESARRENRLREKYKGRLWPDGDYHILTGYSSGNQLTSSFLIYMQE